MTHGIMHELRTLSFFLLFKFRKYLTLSCLLTYSKYLWIINTSNEEFNISFIQLHTNVIKQHEMIIALKGNIRPF
jgi:hypothetical protein